MRLWQPLVVLSLFGAVGVGCSLLGGLDELAGSGQPDAGAGGGSGAGGAGGSGAGTGAAAGDSGASCPPGKKACGAACVDKDDPNTGCGGEDCAPCALGNASALCVGGACMIGQCINGFEDCNGVAADGCEANLKSDAENCGACASKCIVPNANVTCSAGKCVPGACLGGYGDCNSSMGDGCETNTASDPQACGSCGGACPVPAGKSATCEAGKCGVSNCQSPMADCDGDASGSCETNLSTALANCGFCGNGCSYANGNAACASGSCSLSTCKAGFGNCDGNAANGCETDTTLSLAHCGACANACPGGSQASPTCVAGKCGLKCNPGVADCDGVASNGCEANLTTSVQHCGACGAVCSSANGTPSCGGGGCSIACNAGFGNCDNAAANGCETSLSTNSNCGACGAVLNATGTVSPPSGYSADPYLTKVVGNGSKLDFTVCGRDWDYNASCHVQSITLSSFTASGTALPPSGYNTDPRLTKVTSNGTKLDFTVCGKDWDYNSGCHVQSITLSGATAVGTASPPSGYTNDTSLTKVVGGAGKLTFTACGKDWDYNPACNANAAITLNCSK